MNHDKRHHLALILLVSPLAIWLVVFLCFPLLMVLISSFFQRGPYGNIIFELSLQNYARLLDPLYLNIFLKSMAFSLVTTICCLLIGFPMAFAMATSRPALRQWLFLALMIPFLTNFIVRVYAIRVLLSAEGPFNAPLLSVGILAAPVSLNDSLVSVTLGMITNYLPFMVLPLYVTLEKFDYSLLEAGSDLGANWLQLFKKIILPLSIPGILSGSLLVALPVLGEFIIPDLLGGAKNMLVGNLIADQFLKARDWPFGSALTMFLIAIVFLGVILQYALKRGRFA
jgi:spermidine/putrescine transport system permease protein